MIVSDQKRVLVLFIKYKLTHIKTTIERAKLVDAKQGINDKPVIIIKSWLAPLSSLMTLRESTFRSQSNTRKPMKERLFSNDSRVSVDRGVAEEMALPASAKTRFP